MRNETRLKRYEQGTNTTMTSLALAFLAFFAIDVLWLSITPMANAILFTAQAFIWIAFLVDFGIRMYLTDRRWRYIATHPIDVLTIAIPIFRPLRVLRVFTALRILVDRSGEFNIARTWLGVFIAALMLAFSGALVVLDAERNAAGALITTFPDALWWAFVTITTVGYGDEYPITGLGQISAVFLMVSGIGLLGTVTATVAGWFRERLKGEVEAEQSEILAELRALRQEIQELKENKG